MNQFEKQPNNEIEIKGVKIKNEGPYLSTLRTMVNILQNPSLVLHYDQQKNRYYEIESQRTNRFFLTDGIEYCRLRGGGYAVLYSNKEQREQEKINFNILRDKLYGQSTTKSSQIQCPEIWTEFEYENPLEGKRYGLYLSAEQRLLGDTDHKYMDNGVILASGAYLRDHKQDIDTLESV
jgi:hypothetical protein